MWTPEDVLEIHADGWRVELLDGALMMSPAPSRRHQMVSRRLAMLLEAAAEDAGVDCVVYENINVRHDNDFTQPDVVVVEGAVARAGEKSDEDDIWLDPEHVLLAVEIVSPGQAGRDSVDKLKKYASWGIEYYWVLEPNDSVLEGFELRDGAYSSVARVEGAHAAMPPAPFEVTVRPDELRRLRRVTRQND
ncbi:Uma2 family endonuclease [Embleya sp. NPDC020630]|uniref:Uma2 family endonuclease n=1 Tax=Embleya sp. NPDC020630 TaxID=3363979 RepID=UPI00379B6D4B